MNLNPPDYKQRLQALKPNQSFIVRAPAGSGKTAILVQRYLKLLSLVDSPEQIVAITFTKKAAGQMKSRIVKELKEAQKFQKLTHQKEYLSKLDDYQKFNLNLANQALKRDTEKNWNLLLYLDSLKIKTIDAFLQDLTRQLPVASGQESPTEQADFYANQAVKNALNLVDESDAKIKKAYQNLIAYFGYNHQEIMKALAGLLLKREQWLDLNFDADSQNKAIEKIIKIELGKLNNLIQTHYPEAIEILKNAYDLSEKYLNQLSQSKIKLADLFVSNHPNSVASYQTLIKRLVLTGANNNYNFRKTVDKKNGLPAGLTNEEAQNLKIEVTWAKEIRQSLIQLLKDLNDIDGCDKKKALLHQFKLILNLPSVEPNQELIDDLFYLLKYANAELELIFNQQKIVDFLAILIRVLSALGDDNPTDLSLHLDYQIKHLLIDEFQDVSALQVRLIEKLIAGWDESSSDKSLFLVGDPMQSIYGFRKADVRLFNSIEKNKRLSQLPIKAIQLTSNFRSTPDLVELNNQIFSGFSENELYGATRFEKASAFLTAHNNADNSTNTCFYIENPAKASDETGADLEAKLVDIAIEHINKLLKTGQSNIAVLFPTRNKLGQLTDKLTKNQIAFSSIGVDKLMEQIEVLDLLNLVKVLFNQNNQLSWLALMRSVYCSMSLDDLIAMSQYLQKKRNVAKSNYQKIADYRNFLAEKKPNLRLNNLIDVIHPLIYQSEPIYKKVQDFYHQFNLTDYSNQQKANVWQFLTLLKKMNPSNGLEMEAFLTSLAKTTIKSVASEKVQLMTIHAAKGLEFDHVIYFNIASKSKNQADYLLSERIDNHLIVAANEQTEGSVFNWLNLLNKEKEKNEKNRLAYVALTRAKKSNLILFRNNKQDSLIQSIIKNYGGKPIETEIKTEAQNQQNTATTKALGKINQRNQYLQYLALNQKSKKNTHSELTSELRIEKIELRGWQKVYQRDEAPKLNKDKTNLPKKTKQGREPIYFWAGRLARSVGLVAHLFIEKIAEQGLENWDNKKIDESESWIEYQLKKANGGDISKKECENVKKIVKNTISCKYGQFILKSYPNAKNELKMSYLENNQFKNIIIDRSFVDEKGVRWIVDYKTSEHSGSNLEGFLKEEKARYLNQMNQYAKIINQLENGANQKIRLALYFPLHQKLISWQWFE